MDRIGDEKMMVSKAVLTATCFCLALVASTGQARGEKPPEIIELRAHGVPAGLSNNVRGMSDLRVVEAFQRHHPLIKPVPPTGLALPGARAMDVVPLMQIAGDIAPEVLYLSFRSTDTYIRNKFL